MRWTVHLDGGPRRVNHAAVAVGDNIYSFGGYCTGEDYKSPRPMDVHKLDTGCTLIKWYSKITQGKFCLKRSGSELSAESCRCFFIPVYHKKNPVYYVNCLFSII